MKRINPISPSSLKTFIMCPRKYHGQYIAKTIPWSDSPASERGNVLHVQCETALNSGNLDAWMKDTSKCRKCVALHKANKTDLRCGICNGVSRLTVEKFLQNVNKLRDAGWSFQTEKSLATDGRGKALDFWDKTKDNFLRCRVDVVGTHPQKEFAIIVDWKSGKVRPSPEQLYINAWCLAPVTGKTHFLSCFCYIDQDTTKPFTIDLSTVTPKAAIEEGTIPDTGEEREVLVAMKALIDAHTTDEWPRKPQRLCDWCPLQDTCR